MGRPAVTTLRDVEVLQVPSGFRLVLPKGAWLVVQQALGGQFTLIAFVITILGGLIACWYGGDAIVRWCMARPWFAWLSAFSFMIFALHAPLVAYLIDPTIEALQPVPAARLLAFILLPLAVIALCVATGAALRRATPGFYGLLTGGRGMGV